jgi:lipopolysaccharide export system permease protein
MTIAPIGGNKPFILPQMAGFWYNESHRNPLSMKATSVRYVIISRYVIQEVLLATSAVLVVLLFISLTHAFVGYLADAAKGLLPLSLVFKVLWLNTPFLMSFLLPLSFFFGIVLGLGRLYADSEMTALLACGYGLRPLLRTLFLPSAFVMLLTGVLNFYWAPHTMHQLTQAIAQAQQDLLTHLVLPGRFQSTGGGKYVIYIHQVEEGTSNAHGIFIAEQNAQEGANVITSQTGYQWTDEQTQARYIVLEKGERYFGIPGHADYQIVQFEKYGIRLNQEKAEYRLRERMLSSTELLRSNTPKARAEWQWRISLTLSVLVLAMLATLLAELKPRQGKYANALPAILVMIVYTNLLIMAKGWVEDSEEGSFIGMYWVIALGFLVAWIGCARR